MRRTQASWLPPEHHTQDTWVLLLCTVWGKRAAFLHRAGRTWLQGDPGCLHHHVDEVHLQEERGGTQLLLLNHFLLFLSRHLDPCPLQHVACHCP